MPHMHTVNGSISGQPENKIVTQTITYMVYFISISPKDT